MSKYFYRFVVRNMAYVYRHIRLDTGQPFYIGVGADDKGRYSRSKSKDARNKHWHCVVAKCGYEIEIMIDDISYPEALQKEIEFIKLYGRSIDGGLLTNISTGGEGICGVPITEDQRRKFSIAKKGKPSNRKGCKMSDESKTKMSIAAKGRPAHNKGKPWSEEAKKRMSEAKKGKMPKGENHPNYGKPMPAHVKEKLRLSNIGRKPWLTGKKMPVSMRDKMQSHYDSQTKPVVQYDMNWELVGSFTSLKMAAKITGYPKSSISKCCLGYTKQCNGFLWEYLK